MNNEESIINYVLRNELESRNVPVRENAAFKLGRRKYVIDFFCNSISSNARDFLARRNIPIMVVHLNEILYKERRIEDLIASY
jgi:hypothetical protein